MYSFLLAEKTADHVCKDLTYNYESVHSDGVLHVCSFFKRANWFFSPVTFSFCFVRGCITFSLSVSLSSLQALSCFFQLSTLAEDSCSASTSRALFSLKVCSSVSHFLALVLLSERRDEDTQREKERKRGRF